ncbi:hypothetical protein B0H14DRAFT_3427349 [Mycena olivaceomarginata]|nr:hypothetical protein B0H14DRAFT_3427349 [Mycena olivaceomarginata]
MHHTNKPPPRRSPSLSQDDSDLAYAFALSLQSSPTPTAAYGGALNIVELLLKNGVSVNAEGGELGTALQAAASRYRGALEIVELLLLT